MENYIFSKPPPTARHIYLIELDDVNIDERVRSYHGGDANDGVPVGGLCRCENARYAVRHIKTEDDIHLLKEQMDEADCNLMAKEMTVCAIGAIAYDNYTPVTIYASGFA